VQPISSVTDLQTTLDSKVNSSLVGAANGVATLDGQGKVPATQLPSYIDDVLEYPTFNDFPATGDLGKIYLALDTNKLYRWSGSAYIYITSGAVDTVFGRTGVIVAQAGDYTKDQVGLGNVNNTADADKPISIAMQSALDDKENFLGFPTTDGEMVLSDVSGARYFATPFTEAIANTLYQPLGAGGLVQVSLGGSTLLVNSVYNGKSVLMYAPGVDDVILSLDTPSGSPGGSTAFMLIAGTLQGVAVSSQKAFTLTGNQIAINGNIGSIPYATSIDVYTGEVLYVFDSGNVWHVRRLVENRQKVKIISGTSYVLTGNDDGLTLVFTNANPITVSASSGAEFNGGRIDTGRSVGIMQFGAGQVTISPIGYSIKNPNGHTKTSGPNAFISLMTVNVSGIPCIFLAGATA
jgi:hypothetical protein